METNNTMHPELQHLIESGLPLAPFWTDKPYWSHLAQALNAKGALPRVRKGGKPAKRFWTGADLHVYLTNAIASRSA